jgi:uncharacterized protein YciI
VPLNHYVIFATDKPGMMAVRLAARETHRAYIRETNGENVTVVYAGPTLGDDAQMNGSLLVVQAPSKEAVVRFSAADPYALAELFAVVEIREMRVGIARTELMGTI